MRGFCERLAVIAIVLVALAAWTHARPIATATDVPDFAAAIPLSLDGWVGRDAPPLEPDVARVLAADQYVHRYYGKATDRIETDIAYYERPQAGAAMHSPLNCLPGNGWQVIESRTMQLGTGADAPRVRRLIVDRKGYRLVMAYWFQNRAEVIATEYGQRLRLLTSGLRGNPTDAALVRVMAFDTPAGHQAMETFTRALMARLNW
jgi:EpsI family protein